MNFEARQLMCIFLFLVCYRNHCATPEPVLTTAYGKVEMQDSLHEYYDFLRAKKYSFNLVDEFFGTYRKGAK